MDRGRRWTAGVLGACLTAPWLFGAALSRGVRAALVGAGPLQDGRVEPGPSDFPRTLHGPAGEVWVLPRPPRRIVSTYLAADEILAALVPAERVVGLSFFADDPAISNVAGFFPRDVPRLRTNVETVLSLSPDLVCVAGFSDADALRLIIAAGIPVLRWSRFDRFADLLANVRVMGAAVGAEARAASICGAVEETLADLSRRLAGRRPVRALYLELPGFTAGRGTLIDEMLSRVAAVNVAAEAGLVGAGPIGLELAMAAAPEAIVIPSYGSGPTGLDQLRASVGWRDAPAVRSGRVLDVPGRFIGDVSPHAATGLGLLARALHPAAFDAG